MKSSYDLIVIGAGSAGLSVAIAMKRLNFEVLIIERDDHHIGGDCLNDGCVPSKALIHISRQVQAARQATAFGLQLQGEVNLASVMQYVRERQDIIRVHENARHLREKEKLDVVLGTARFVGEREVEVNTLQGERQRFSAKNIVICTGSIPQPLEAAGIKQVTIHTNQTIFGLTELPKQLLVVGAGPIGIEMGQAFARLGSQVTVVGSEDRILSKELPEVSALLQQRLEQEGVTFILNSKVTQFTDAHTAIIETATGSTQTAPFDVVLVAIGRTFRHEPLNLPSAGIDLDEKGRIKLNDYLQTTNKHVFAAGDAAAGLPAGQYFFSHASELHASTLVSNFITPGPFDKKLSYDHFSWVTFTDPEVATFGCSEKQLNQKGTTYERLVYDFAHDDRAVIENYEYAKMYLLIEPSVNPFGAKILGGTVIAPNAGELVQELILAQQHKLTAGDFFNKIYPYPTASRVNKSIWVDRISESLPDVLKKAVKWLY